jgi:hypothetical protein
MSAKFWMCATAKFLARAGQLIGHPKPRATWARQYFRASERFSRESEWFLREDDRIVRAEECGRCTRR